MFFVWKNKNSFFKLSILVFNLLIFTFCSFGMLFGSESCSEPSIMPHPGTPGNSDAPVCNSNRDVSSPSEAHSAIIDSGSSSSCRSSDSLMDFSESSPDESSLYLEQMKRYCEYKMKEAISEWVYSSFPDKFGKDSLTPVSVKENIQYRLGKLKKNIQDRLGELPDKCKIDSSVTAIIDLIDKTKLSNKYVALITLSEALDIILGYIDRRDADLYWLVDLLYDNATRAVTSSSILETACAISILNSGIAGIGSTKNVKRSDKKEYDFLICADEETDETTDCKYYMEVKSHIAFLFTGKEDRRSNGSDSSRPGRERINEKSVSFFNCSDKSDKRNIKDELGDEKIKILLLNLVGVDIVFLKWIRDTLKKEETEIGKLLQAKAFFVIGLDDGMNKQWKVFNWDDFCKILELDSCDFTERFCLSLYQNLLRGFLVAKGSFYIADEEDADETASLRTSSVSSETDRSKESILKVKSVEDLGGTLDEIRRSVQSVSLRLSFSLDNMPRILRARLKASEKEPLKGSSPKPSKKKRNKADCDSFCQLLMSEELGGMGTILGLPDKFGSVLDTTG